MARSLLPEKLEVARDFFIAGNIREFSCNSIRIQEILLKIPSL